MMDINTRPFDDDDARHADSVTDAELLVTRLIDHEATTEDRQAFEALAAAEPSLWRQLARRLEDMALLRAAVDDETNDAATAELNELLDRRKGRAGIEPPTIETGWHSGNSGARWAVSMLGWAAAVVFAIVWQISTTTSTPGGAGGGSDLISVGNVEESYAEYLEAPFVLNEVRPQLLSIENLADGRVIMEFLRCVEEVVIIESEQDLPASIDTFDLTDYRRSVQGEQGRSAEGAAEDELAQYLQAPYVIGEYQPMLLDIEELDDGRYILRIMRRFGEVAMFESPADVPVLVDGTLDFNPSEFRRTQQHKPMS